MLAIEPFACRTQDHTVAERYSLARCSSIVDHPIVGPVLSTVDAADNTAGMFGLQVQAIDTDSKDCYNTQSKIELHGSVMSKDARTI
jgi:hypothetical protein